jgi:muramoyltetrapeptide carboxypeptidase
VTAASHWPCPRLTPGARLRLIAPSGRFDVALFERGVARLRQRYEVVYDPAITEHTGFLAGSDARRLAELEAALDDREAVGLLAARGGYGATRLLDRLDPGRVRRAEKVLIGFSDLTALHALWARAELGSLHGPMTASLATLDEPALARWFEALEAEPGAALLGLSALCGGRAQGRLLGGNLAVLCALLGTPYLPPLDGAVLFLEDVGERPYRVDRMLTSLAQAGVLARLAGVALGGFTEAAPGPDGVRVEQVLAERLGGLPIPVVSGVPAGHLDDNRMLHFGRLVELDADAGSLAYL